MAAPKIAGFIGLGNMGSYMARNMINKGKYIYNQVVR